MVQHEFLSKVPIPDDNLVTIDDWDVCSAAANGYEARLKYVLHNLRFIVLFLVCDVLGLSLDQNCWSPLLLVFPLVLLLFLFSSLFLSESLENYRNLFGRVRQKTIFPSAFRDGGVLAWNCLLRLCVDVDTEKWWRGRFYTPPMWIIINFLVLIL